MSVVDFLLNLRRAVSLYTNSITSIENITLTERRLNILKLNMVLAYYEILESYFNTIISGDDNFYTETECQVAIDKLNNILDTYLYVDFN